MVNFSSYINKIAVPTPPCFGAQALLVARNIEGGRVVLCEAKF